MIYPIEPIAKPRMTRRDKWQVRPCVAKYRVFKDLIALHKIKISETVCVVFHIPMPRSWSKKKRKANEGKPHKQKPDIDNLLKALLDATLADDAHVWSVTAEKRWSVSGAIELIENAQEKIGKESQL